MQKPVYLFSMPRSGSTLLQRILAGNSAIATVSEPWILLPFLYTLRDTGFVTEYRHFDALSAIEDLLEQLPNGREDYEEEIRNMVLSLYEKVSPEGTQYFLDKTPRYNLIVEEVIKIFAAEAKFIFLWRNPLAIAASISQTYGEGRWNIYDFNVDFFKGMPNLIAAYQKHKDQAFAIKYEDFILDPKGHLLQMLDFLELSHDQSEIMLKTFSKKKLEGHMGDPTGSKTYKKVNTDPLQKWKKSFNNPFRKAWGRRYLRWLGEERLAEMGYDMHALIAELNAIPNRLDTVGADLLRTTIGPVHSLYKSFIPLLQKALKYRIKIS
jgi:hypothetical protein